MVTEMALGLTSFTMVLSVLGKKLIYGGRGKGEGGKCVLMEERLKNESPPRTARTNIQERRVVF